MKNLFQHVLTCAVIYLIAHFFPVISEQEKYVAILIWIGLVLFCELTINILLSEPIR